MARTARDRVPFRRRREGKTDFRCRLRLLRSHLPRAVVRRTLTKVMVQFIEYSPVGDKVVAQATSAELKKFGWDKSQTNLTSAYLTGVLAAKRAKSKKISEAVLDIGLQTPTKGSRVFASLKGILDGGVDVPHGEDVLPETERLTKCIDEKGLNSIKSKILEG